MEKPWKVVVAFIGVFMAGAVFGGFFSLRNPSRRVPESPPIQVLPPPMQPQFAGPQASSSPALPRSSPITPVLMKQFRKSLKLTPEQSEKLQPILSRAGEDFQRLRDEDARRRQDHLADVARVNERMYVDISNTLTEAQRAELQRMRQQVEEKIQAEKQKRADAAAAEAAARSAMKSKRKDGGESK